MMFKVLCKMLAMPSWMRCLLVGAETAMHSPAERPTNPQTLAIFATQATAMWQTRSGVEKASLEESGV